MRLTDKMLLTYDEAATVLNLSKSTVQKLIREGKLIRVAPGPQKRLVPMTSIQEYIAALVEEAKTATADEPAA